MHGEPSIPGQAPFCDSRGILVIRADGINRQCDARQSWTRIRAKRRLPAWSTRPSRAVASTSRSVTGSPSILTAPPLDEATGVAARADAHRLRQQGRQMDITGRGTATSAMSSGAAFSLWMPIEARLAVGARAPRRGSGRRPAAPDGASRAFGCPWGQARRGTGARTTRHRPVRDAHDLAELLSGRLGDADVVAGRLAHPLLAVRSREDRHGHRALGRLTVLLLDLTSEHQIEELVRTAELDVGLETPPSRRPASGGRAAPARRSAHPGRCDRRSRCAAGAG